MTRALVGVAFWIVAHCFLAPGAEAAGASAKPIPPPVAVVKDLYAAFGRDDIAQIMTLVSPHVVWTFHGPVNVIPYAGVYKGPLGVKEFFADVAATIDVRKVVERRFIASGDQVAVAGWERSVARGTGGIYLAHWLHLFTVRNGRISRFEEFTDTAAIAAALAPADPARGKAYFTTCAGCHGRAAQGNRYMHAPDLTIQGSGYLLTQLRRFYDGMRGGPQDLYGWQMNGRTRALPDDRALRDVIAYVGTLPNVHAVPTVRADATAGKALYRACVGCHGVRGEGTAAGVPALAGLDDWYVVDQLNAYRSGRRRAYGIKGAGMRAAALGLPSENAVRNVATYIAGLP